MILNSTQLTILMGPTIPVPLSLTLTEAIRSVEVTQNDSGRSGFQIEFTVGRPNGLLGANDYPLLNDRQVQQSNRVIIIVTLNATPTMIMDGIITYVQLTPSNDPGASRYIVTGEDISLKMDLVEKCISHAAQSEDEIAAAILEQYLEFDIEPEIIPPPVVDPPSPSWRIPTQYGTDLQYLQEIAARFNYVFYISTGPKPFVNKAYWGPPNWTATPQPALAVNMGPATNVKSLNFSTNAISPVMINAGLIQDSLTGKICPIFAPINTLPPLGADQLSFNPRTVFPRGIDGYDCQQAYARAQAIVNNSWEHAVTASGEVDIANYGTILQARSLVGVRGAGFTYDGLYYVQSVNHRIQLGDYVQNFTLLRQGLDSTVPVV